MIRAKKRTRDYEAALEREINKTPGAQYEFLPCAGSSHRVARISLNGLSRKVFFPASPSNNRGPLNFAQDVRRALRGMTPNP